MLFTRILLFNYIAGSFDMGLVAKFRNGKRCRRKLEKQNIRLDALLTFFSSRASCKETQYAN